MNNLSIFFENSEPFTSEELVMSMDLFSIMNLIKVGKKLKEYVKDEISEVALIGSQKEVDSIMEYDHRLNRNYTALMGAYKIAMT